MNTCVRGKFACWLWGPPAASSKLTWFRGTQGHETELMTCHRTLPLGGCSAGSVTIVARPLSAPLLLVRSYAPVSACEFVFLIIPECPIICYLLPIAFLHFQVRLQIPVNAVIPTSDQMPPGPASV
eukprot:9988577-Karenia_brevis.AAC.1